jgi:hypothetical protein
MPDWSRKYLGWHSKAGRVSRDRVGRGRIGRGRIGKGRVGRGRHNLLVSWANPMTVLDFYRNYSRPRSINNNRPTTAIIY